METLIIQVDCRPYLHGSPPQLGITVEVPTSQQRALLQKRQQSQASSREYHNHDYQNLDNLNIPGLNNNGGSTKSNNSISRNNYKNGHPCLKNNNRQHIANVFHGPQEVHEGLQITQIQHGSIIERNGQFKIGDIIVECNGVNLQRPFPEAQRTLKQFVNEHTSHAPLVLKVLRKSASSSSIPSTTGSQITVIENDNIYPKNSLKSSAMITTLRPTGSQQQASTSTSEDATLSKSLSSSSSHPSRYLVDSLNTRKIGVKHTIKLKKGATGGFGIKIAERDNMHGIRKRPIYITAITTSGSAYTDGRLREGDMLLQINGCDLQGKSQPEVIRMLKNVGMNEEVEFVVSRQEIASTDDDSKLQKSSSASKIRTENDCDKSLIDLDDSVFESSDHQIEQKIDNVLNIPVKDKPGTYVYDIPLNDTKSAGLGLYLKYPIRAEDHKDLGIWIEKVITGGAAWKDSRLQPDDQILAINGINLVGLSNAEASETLTAAVCRGIGPEATSNIIRLKIHRRDPSVVAKILQGTDNRIEYSDIIPINGDKTFSIHDKNYDNSCDSYQTALENTAQYKQHELRDSSDSSNQNSQNDSVMSPQTQASNSLKLSNSYNDKSDQNSSDKTNETTSSAISQITNSTNNVPINDFTAADQNYDQNHDSQLVTKPKSINTDPSNDLQTVDCTSSLQSWDDESTDAIPGEERFQRDGFGRQSISEKRHHLLNSKNTDTWKRNQRLREEREQQRQLEEQLARQRLDDDRRRSYHLQDNSQNMAVIHNLSEFKSRPDLQNRVVELMPNEQGYGYHREVPVDVLMPNEAKAERDHIDIRRDNPYIYNDVGARCNNEKVPYYDNKIVNSQTGHMLPVNYCLKCGSTSSPCSCENNQIIRNQIYGIGQRTDQIIKRSNSLESVQQHQVREGLIIPRAGTVRVARNRKVNESFRAAVDRSYESSVNESNSKQNQSDMSDPRHMSSKMAGSIANSTASTSNEERYLISSNNAPNDNCNTTHKKSSLLTRFLGSIKRKKKNRNPQDDSKPIEMKSSAPKPNRGSERSQSSKGSHARTHSSQSHPILNSHKCDPLDMKHDPLVNGQLYSNNIKQAAASTASHHQNGFDTNHQQASLPICQQQYQSMHNPSAHYKMQAHLHHPPMTQAKYPIDITSMAPARPQAGNNLSAYQQYSHVPLHPNQHQHATLSSHHLHHQLGASQIVPDSVNDHNHYSTHNPMILNSQMNNRMSNGHQTQPLGGPTQWQSSHFQAPNGLWVTNSPVSDNHIHQHNSYGSLAQYQNATSSAVNMQRSSLQPHLVPHMQQTSAPNYDLIGGPYTTSVNGNSNGMMQHGSSNQEPLYSDHLNNNHQSVPFSTVQPQMHNHLQPQHIYYYDF